MATIDTVYRTRIYVECDDYKVWDSVENRLFRFSYKEKDVEFSTMVNPTCDSYFELESQNRKALERFIGKIERYIGKRSGISILNY